MSTAPPSISVAPPSKAGSSHLRARLSLNVTERLVGGAIGFGLVGLGWWIAANALGPTRLPSPLAVASAFPVLLTSSSSLEAQGVSGGILQGLLYTTRQVLLGVALGALVGGAMGVALALSRWLREIFHVTVEVIRTIPPLAAIPFFLIWFGTSPTGQLLVIAFYTSVMVLVTARSAVDHLPPIYPTYAATLGATRAQRIRTVVLPGMVPEVVGGLRVALGFSWGIAVVAELLGAQQGIGYNLMLLSTVLEVEAIMAGIIWISLIATVIDRCYMAVTHRATRWVPKTQ